MLMMILPIGIAALCTAAERRSRQSNRQQGPLSQQTDDRYSRPCQLTLPASFEPGQDTMTFILDTELVAIAADDHDQRFALRPPFLND